MTPAEEKFALRVPDDVAAVLKKLHPAIKSQVRAGLGSILANPYRGKALKDELYGLRSYRVKRFRIIYRVKVENRQIELIAVGPRRIIYEETFRILSQKRLS